MKKEEILKHLRNAKQSHVRWVQNAKLLIKGIDINEEAIPISYTDCKFGKWFYSDGQILNGLPNNPLESMKEIENLHTALHDTYLKIFNIYFAKNKKSGFLSKLFNIKKRKKNISVEDLNKAQQYYEELENISKKLLDEINVLERRIIAIPEEKIEELI